MKQLAVVLMVFLFSLTNFCSVFAETPKPKQPNPVKKRLISFSGLSWEVKTSANRSVGPGPNIFSDSQDNVWLDEEGNLHLRITKKNDRYICAEVVCLKSFGYGAYRFHVKKVNNLDKSVVGGLFTWDNTDPAYSHREIDFEYGYWQDLNAPNFQMVVQPYQKKERIKRCEMVVNRPVIHEFNWQPNQIKYSSVDLIVKPDKPLAEWIFSGLDIPKPGREQARINLWLFGKGTFVSGKEPEMVISRFEFKK